MRVLLWICFFAVAVEVPAQEFHIVFLNKKEDKKQLPEEEVKRLMDGHMANINQLAKEGKLWAAGPFDGGGGIFIFKSPSIEDVKSWILTDPAVAAERWNVEIFSYTPRIGSVCAVGEKFEMTNYYFVRYYVDQAKANEEEWKQHQKFLEPWVNDGKVITEASLGASEGAILVLREEPQSEKLAEDPAVKKGTLKPAILKIFIAKGSFCEPR